MSSKAKFINIIGTFWKLRNTKISMQGLIENDFSNENPSHKVES